MTQTTDHPTDAHLAAEAQARFLADAGSLAADLDEARDWIQKNWRGGDLPPMRIRDVAGRDALIRFDAMCGDADTLTACARVLLAGGAVTQTVTEWGAHLTTPTYDGDVHVTRRFGRVEVAAFRVGMVAELRATPVLAGAIKPVVSA